jgi:protein TonB
MMFKDSLFASERNLGVRAVAFPFSLAAHVLFGLLLIILPLIRGVRFPRVEFVHAFLAPPPPSPPPPPPGKKHAGAKSGARIKRVQAQSAPAGMLLIAPMDIPDFIAEEYVGFDEGFGVEGGVEGAPVEGFFKGVVGPVLAGVVGRNEVPVRAGIGEIKQPKRVRYVEPVYPEIARQARVEGVVIIEATTDPFGRVVSWNVLKSIPLLDEAAVEAVRQWQYEPMVINGRPRGVTFTVTVIFQLR